MKARFWVACLLVAAACGGSPPQDGATSPTPPGIDYLDFGSPTPVGTGLVAGASPDGSAVYLEEPDPERFPETGCEGQPEPALFRQPLDGGERSLAAEGDRPLNGLLVRGGRAGRVAVVAQCEGFFTSLTLATEAPAGRLTELQTVEVQEPEGFGLNPTSIAWSADGSRLLGALGDFDAPDGDPPRVVEIDPGSGELTTLFEGDQGTGILALGQLEDGTYVVASNLVVSFLDSGGRELNRVAGSGFTIAPDGRHLVVFGEALTYLDRSDAEPLELLPAETGTRIWEARFSPDGRAVVAARQDLEGGGVELGIARVDGGGYRQIVTGAQYGRAHFTGDGTGAVFNEFGTEPDFASRAHLIRFGEAE